LTSATSSEKGGCSCRTARASRNRLALAALVFGLGLLFARLVRPAASLGR
jgi:MYXO-CTERM domain-containing protein